MRSRTTLFQGITGTPWNGEHLIQRAKIKHMAVININALKSHVDAKNNMGWQITTHCAEYSRQQFKWFQNCQNSSFGMLAHFKMCILFLVILKIMFIIYYEKRCKTNLFRNRRNVSSDFPINEWKIFFRWCRRQDGVANRHPNARSIAGNNYHERLAVIFQWR